jgi:SAM-dependent methyltransferase
VADLELEQPPLELANRVGSLAEAPDPFAYYEELGHGTRQGIVDRLPPDWTFRGKRVLDFGCGAGRTLRHFTDEASAAEFWGCDIDDASINWMEKHMCPPFQVFVNGVEPPLDRPDASFDLIWAISVFTHLPESWSRWLVELNRLLKPDGLLFVTFMGRGMSEEIAGESWNEKKFGMNVIKYGQGWDLGGPMVLHSPWWIEEHWGRAFEILSLEPDGFASKPWLDHGSVLMRRRGHVVDSEELERMAAPYAREAHALAHNVKQLRLECLDLREGLAHVDSKLAERVEQKRILEAQVADLVRVREEADAVRAEADAVRGEMDAVRSEADALRGEAAKLHRKTVAAQRQATEARERSQSSAQRLLEVEEIIAQSMARIFALEEALEELHSKLERADVVMSAMKASISWRVTAPLRALKRTR